MAKQDTYQKTALRIPRDLHAEIHAAAEESGRSMNAEIIARLEKSFEGGGETQFLNYLNDSFRKMLGDMGLEPRDMWQLSESERSKVKPEDRSKALIRARKILEESMAKEGDD